MRILAISLISPIINGVYILVEVSFYKCNIIHKFYQKCQNKKKTNNKQTKQTISESVLTGLIPPAATNSSFSKSKPKSRSRPLGQNIDTNSKVSSKGIDMCNIKS